MAIPVSKLDGLLTAELILSLADRKKMSNAIRDMQYLDAHDAITLADSLDQCTDGILPEAPKMSLTEMEKA